MAGCNTKIFAAPIVKSSQAESERGCSGFRVHAVKVALAALCYLDTTDYSRCLVELSHPKRCSKRFWHFLQQYQQGMAILQHHICHRPFHKSGQNGVSDRCRPHCPDLKSILALKVSQYDVQHGEGFEQIQDAISKPAIAIRCKHAIGGWCLRALSSNLTTIATPPPLGTRSCTAGCNGVGNCNADTGACDCPAGIALPF